MIQPPIINPHPKVRGEWLIRELAELVGFVLLIAAFVYLVTLPAVPDVYKGTAGTLLTMAATFYYAYRAGGKGPNGSPPSE